MAPSQLKQLKASIHERRNGGIATKQSTTATQLKQSPSNGFRNSYASQSQQKRRPKSHGEEVRKATLLYEMQRRHKVGSIIDRRIGENDPTMSPEDRMLQRYARQRSKRDMLFDLEEADDDEQLTHLGRTLSSSDFLPEEGAVKDDFNEVVSLDSDEDDPGDSPPAKRRRLSNETDARKESLLDGLGTEVGWKKTKNEVMQEMIAKSKLHKYERQQAKEDDDDLREELDKGLPDLLALLRGRKVPQPPAPTAKEDDSKNVAQPNAMHPDRLAQMNGEQVRPKPIDKQYDERVRQMVLDKRAQPTERTKTEEEKAADAAAKLKELEAKRLRRMRGEPDSEEEQIDDLSGYAGEDEDQNYQGDDDIPNEAAAFGLEDANKAEILGDGVEDEDDFIIDDDLVASGSELDDGDMLSTDSENENKGTTRNHGMDNDDDDDEFLRDVIQPRSISLNGKSDEPKASTSTSLSYTYPCPQSHDEFLKITSSIEQNDLVTVIQRIRALHHAQLNPQNKERLSNFASVLIDHIHHLGMQKQPTIIIQAVIRHVHSMAKSYPDAVSTTFRIKLQRICEEDTMSAGDLALLTAIGNIFSTSDHFHQVVTPAITIMSRWLGLKKPKTSRDSWTGCFLVALCMKYQSYSKRYVPEAVSFTVSALEQSKDQGLMAFHLRNVSAMASIWADQPAFIEIFSRGSLEALKAIPAGRSTAKQLRRQLKHSQKKRRPLELHHHRPLPIRSAIPQFEEGFNPNKHYDPDRDKAEASRLRHEYKRERKGALRALRNDSSFIAREKLKSKKEADRAYEAKQRRLIAEIQSEEGREKNAYERERQARRAAHR